MSTPAVSLLVAPVHPLPAGDGVVEDGVSEVAAGVHAPAIGVIAAVAAARTVHQIAEGKAKRVHEVIRGGVPDRDSVLITPQPVIGAQREIEEELRTATDIKKKLFKRVLVALHVEAGSSIRDNRARNAVNLIFEEFPDGVLGVDEEEVRARLLERRIPHSVALMIARNIGRFTEGRGHLAVSLRVATPAEQVGSEYTLVAPRAAGDLQRMLEAGRGTLTLAQRLRFCKEVVSSLYYLHSIGMIHGDIKTDNILLVNGRFVLADFGKTGSPDARGVSRGNLRYAAPEQLRTQSGEVFSMALLLIRILEDGFLGGNEDMLVQSGQAKADPAEGRRGIERFVIQSSQCPNDESKLGTRVASVFRGIFPIPVKRAASEAIGHYVFSLLGHLEGEGDIPDPVARPLFYLLMEMIAASPVERPTMEEVKRRIDQIEFPVPVVAVAAEAVAVPVEE
jgi:hypothetical protein